MPGGSGASDERLIEAHRALRQAGDVQFDMVPAAGPPPPPAWLKAFGEWLERVLAPVGRFFHWIGSMMPDAPYARIFLWSMLALLAALILWMVYDRVRHGVWRMPRFRRKRMIAATDAAADDWTPDVAPARAWLEEADRLAKEERYAEAVHHLLLRSVEDLSRRRPQVVRPSLTSRDLAHAPGIPSAPRRLFAEIAVAVEKSLFGGRSVDAEEWGRCRAAYADFAKTRNWAQ